MNYDEPIEIIENDVLIVAVTDFQSSYLMWQKGITEEVGLNDGVYFEYDDQINAGHDNVKECSVDSDGVHIILTSNKLVHFYFPSGFNKHKEFKAALEKVYDVSSNILEIKI